MGESTRFSRALDDSKADLPPPLLQVVLAATRRRRRRRSRLGAEPDSPEPSSSAIRLHAGTGSKRRRRGAPPRPRFFRAPIPSSPSFSRGGFQRRTRMRGLPIGARRRRASQASAEMQPRIPRGLHRHVVSVSLHVSALPKLRRVGERIGSGVGQRRRSADQRRFRRGRGERE